MRMLPVSSFVRPNISFRKRGHSFQNHEREKDYLAHLARNNKYQSLGNALLFAPVAVLVVRILILLWIKPPTPETSSSRVISLFAPFLTAICSVTIVATRDSLILGYSYLSPAGGHRERSKR
jgi:hypothetical protein